MVVRLIIGFSFLLISFESISNEYSYDLIEPKIGTVYPSKFIFPRPEDRPTIQFNAPNRGELKNIFPFYSLVLDKESLKVAVSFAEIPVEGLDECNKKKDEVHNVLVKKLNGLKYSQQDRVYKTEDPNVSISLECMVKENSPFYSLSIDIRGETESEAIKKAWEKYFGN